MKNKKILISPHVFPLFYVGCVSVLLYLYWRESQKIREKNVTLLAKKRFSWDNFVKEYLNE